MEQIIQDKTVDCQQSNMFEPTGKTCNNKTMTLGTRLRTAREAAGYSQKDLARKAGIRQQSIQSIEDGTTKHPRKLSQIESILGLPQGYLLYGEENCIDLPQPIIARCPILSWEDAKDWPQNKNYVLTKKIEQLTHQVILSHNSYALKIEDNSMVNYRLAEGFHKGKYIIVDPAREYRDGNFVIARKENSEKLLFRQYVNDAGDKYLNPLDIANYQRVPVSSDIAICGVVVAYLDLLV